MLVYLIFTCFLLVVPAKFETVDELDEFVPIEVDEKCAKEKLIDYKKIKNEFKFCNSDRKQKLLPITSTEIYVNQLCSTDKDVQCADVLKKKLYPCLSESQKEFLFHRSASEKAIMEYICKNDAKEFKEIITLDFTQCKFEDFSQRCDKSVQSLTGITTENFFEDENCRNFLTLVDCFANVAKSCQSRALVNFVKNVANVGFSATPCKEYINGSLSSTRVFSFLFLFTLFVCIRNQYLYIQ